jgi:hypothetical protein
MIDEGYREIVGCPGGGGGYLAGNEIAAARDW